MILIGSTVAVMARSVMSPNEEQVPSVAVPVAVKMPADNPVKMQRPFMDGDFEFVSSSLIKQL